jgi:hypothetical protein
MCYDLPCTFNKRSSGFGIGQRFNLPIDHRKKSPDPGVYQLKSDFDIGKPSTANTAKGGTKRGIYTFGIGRHNYQKVYFPDDPKMAADFSKIPGPGTYTTKLMTLGHDGHKWNF